MSLSTTHHTMTCGDVGGRVAGGACSSLAAEWPDPEGRDGAPIPEPGGCACAFKTGWLWALQTMAKREQIGRRDEVKGRTQRRMAIAFRWVCLERPLGSV